MGAVWEQRKLGDLAKVISGYAFRSEDFHDTGVPVIKIANIRNGYVDLSAFQCVDEKFLALDPKYHVKRGDLLISLTGSHLTQPNSVVGRVAFYDSTLSSCLLNQRAGKIIPLRDDVCDQRFLFYTLSMPDKSRSIALMAHGAASQANISPSQVESLVLDVPDVQTQHRIASILGVYDDLIENNLRRIKILEEMAQSLYKEWFVNFRFPGHKKHGPRPTSNESCKPTKPNTPGWHPSPLGPIPTGWQVGTFGEVASNSDRLRKPLSGMEREKMQGKYPYYGAAKLLDHVNDYIFDGTYLLVAEDGSVITPDRRPVLQYVKGKFWVNNHTHIIQGTPPVSTEILCLCLRNLDVSGYITGAAQPKITQANMNRIPVLLPVHELLHTFDAFVQPVFAQTLVLEERDINLRQTRDLLLPKLISGEVAVSGLDDAPIGIVDTISDDGPYNESSDSERIQGKQLDLIPIAAEAPASYSTTKKAGRDA